MRADPATPDASVRGPDYPTRSYAWFVVVLLIGTAILSYTDRQVLSLLVDPIRHDLGISDSQISAVFGMAFGIVYGVAGVPFGFFADRTSRRNLILFGVAVWSVGTVACGYAHNFNELFAARMVVGIGESILSPAAISLISDYFPPSRRGFAVGCFLSGIAIGSGASILIGGGVLHLVEAGALAGTPLATTAPWRLVLLLIGTPGFAWALAILLIREPLRRTSSSAGAASAANATVGDRLDAVLVVAPVYFIVAMASLVDNAVGAWAPTLLIRDFHRDAAQVGVDLGILLTAAFGGGVLLGGWLADRVGGTGHWRRKLVVCLVASVLILPVAAMFDSSTLAVVMTAVPLYFALSGIVTACGFSAILDAVPNRQRGFAMAVSFFLNVALGAGFGPSVVTFLSSRIFGAAAGLGPALGTTVGGVYALTLIATILAVTVLTPRSASSSTQLATD
jgi:MFS family permease